MFSPRIVAVFAILLAAVAALPATNKSDLPATNKSDLPATDKPAIPRPVTTITEDDVDDSPWLGFPLFGNLFAPLWRLLPSFGDIGPKIISDDDKFRVIVNVKDYKKDDLKVKVKGELIFVQGSQEAKHDDHDVFASQFFHTYTLPVNSSGSDVTVELTSDGFLVVTAPLNGPVTRAKDVDRDVPIIETGAPLPKEETKPKNETTKPPQSAEAGVPSVTEDDRKEPTTPSSEVTDKDNSIPHGNETSL